MKIVLIAHCKKKQTRATPLRTKMPRCKSCGHYGDDWQVLGDELDKDGNYTTRKGRTYPVVKHPHEREYVTYNDGTRERVPMYRIIPCENCPEQFKDKFWSKQDHDEEVASALKNGF